MRLWSYPLIVFCAAIVAIGTLTITPSVGKQELPEVQYGYPFHFATSNADQFDPPRGTKTSIPFNPRENPTRLHLGLLIASIAAIAALPLAIVLALQWRYRRRSAEAT